MNNSRKRDKATRPGARPVESQPIDLPPSERISERVQALLNLKEAAEHEAGPRRRALEARIEEVDTE